MRKLRLLTFFLFAITFMVGCTKEGPEGPVGATGAQGPPGIQGPQGSQGVKGDPGTANVIYSSWYTTVAADWAALGSLVGPYYEEFRYNRAAPGITQAVLDNGVVLCYMKDWIYEDDVTGDPAHSSSVVQLPYFADLFYGDYWDFALTAPGNIRYMYKSGNAWVPSVVTGISYRYVIIPGGVSGGRMITGPAKDKTVAQLKKMAYEDVLSLFKIPANGSNIGD